MALSEHDLVGAAVASGLIAREEVEDIRREARRLRLQLIDAVARLGKVPIQAMWQAAAEQRGLPFLSPRSLAPRAEDMDRLPSGFVLRRQCMPVRGASDEVILALANPDDVATIDQVSRSLGTEVTPALAHPDALEGAIQRALGDVADAAIATEDAVSLVEEIISDALLAGASDIHIEPGEQRFSVRLRVDGRLQDWRRDLRSSESDPVINRIKVLADLDIAESRSPQDGGFNYELDEHEVRRVEIRVSTLPVKWGERLTMRILGLTGEQFDLESLGLPGMIKSRLQTAIGLPHGVILVTGPTGSGKSTTLYSALRRLDRHSFNVMTVEDPIEQIVEATAQTQVSTKVSFAGALRSILRQDPDVILIGEIRDHETADIALKAAQTGHLVFSTLHTNNAVGAITRLTDLEVGRYQIAASLEGVLAQRLVRRLCKRCKIARQVRPEEYELLSRMLEGDVPTTVYDPKGCPACLGTGYRGRVGVFEALWIDEGLRTRISDGQSELSLLQHAEEFHPLTFDLAAKVRDGLTDFGEARRFGLRHDT
ncbi:MAG: ATPase, T2SS/T4P/T4SS family [Pseudomonadota bacterium]